jgi:predicted porin
MKKKLIIAAVGAALVAGAGLAQADFKASGAMDVSVDNIKGKEGALSQYATKTNVSSNSSNITFGGAEDLGGGMAAVWNVTTFVRLDNSSSTFGNGNTYIGLGTPAGTVVLGKHDTPVKLLGRAVDLFGNHLGDSRNLTNADALGGGTVGAAYGLGTTGWDIRPQNVIAYISPTFSGVTAIVADVTNLADTANTHDAITAVSGLVQWANGPYLAGVGYERHHANVALTVGADKVDSSIIRAVGKAGFGDFAVVALYQKEKDVNFLAGYDRSVYGVGGSYTFMGNNTVKAQYYKAGDIKGDKAGAKMMAVGFDHAMSKTTTLYVDYAQTKNDKGAGATFSMAAGGHGDDPGAVADKTMSGYGVGMITKF